MVIHFFCYDSRHNNIHLCIRPGKSLQFYRGKDGKVSLRISGGNTLTVKNQLRKRFADCSRDLWTSVELELQTSEPLPVLADLTRFLVSSVTFLTNIHTISIDLDCQRLLHICKEPCKLPVKVPIPIHLMPTTLSETLTVESIERTGKAIHARRFWPTLILPSSKDHDRCYRMGVCLRSDVIVVPCRYR